MSRYPSERARHAAKSSESGSSNSAMIPYTAGGFSRSSVSVCMRRLRGRTGLRVWFIMMNHFAHFENRNRGYTADKEEHQGKKQADGTEVRAPIPDRGVVH